MNTIFLIEIFILSLGFVHGTHFLGGTITWHPLNPLSTTSPVSIVITQTYLWTYSTGPCTSSDIANSNSIPFIINYQGISNKLNCVLNCGTASGYVAPPIWPYCTDASSTQGTTVGQRSDTVSVPITANFTVAFASSSWRVLATNTAADWSLSALIRLTLRSDNGLINNSPVATVMSPINIPKNQLTVINIPIADADNDVLRCRWSSGSTECGDVCPPSSLPSGTVIYPNCTITITGTNVGDWFAITVQVEDFINSTSTTPLSSVPVQFLVHVVAPPSCTTPPDVLAFSNRSCIPVTVGQKFTTRLIAINYCGSSVSIVDIATLSFSGMVESSLIKQDSSTYYKTLTWTPQNSQVGYQVMCAMAIDSQQAQSSQYCFIFYVSTTNDGRCPGDPTTTSTTTTSTSQTTETTTTSTTSTTTTSTSTTTTSTTTTSTTTTTTSTTTTTTTSTTSTTSTSTTSTTSTSTTTTTKPPDSINWPLIGSIIGCVLLGLLSLCCCAYWYYCCIPVGLGIPEENGPFELYHIDHCTDPECLWSSDSHSSVLHSSAKSTKFGIYSISHDNTTSYSINGHLLSNSNEDENDLEMIDFDLSRPKSVNSEHVFVRKVRKTHSADKTNLKSPIRKLNDYDLLSLQRLNSGGSVRVIRVKSSTVHDNKLINQQKEETINESEAIIRVIHVPAIHSAPVEHSRSSIIENTIQLDENDKTISSARSSKKKKSKVRIQRVTSAHRTSAIESRVSQIDTIELPSTTLNNIIEETATPSVHVERVRKGRKKLKSPKSIVPFESITEETTAQEFSVVVKKVPREERAKLIK